MSKVERAVKNRRMLEYLCEGLRMVAECTAPTDAVQEFRMYFCSKLKACLVQMHAAASLAKHADGNGHAHFADNLKYVREFLPRYVDTNFQLWLVEITYHILSTSFRIENNTEVHKAIDFSNKFLSMAAENSVPPDVRVYHLIISAFYLLRTGQMKKMSLLIDEIKALQANRGAEKKLSGILHASYLESIIDALQLNVMACSDPVQAMKLSTKRIHLLQANLPTYSVYPAVHLMLTATLFDMLHLHCRLQAQQCRYLEMGTSIKQMVTLFTMYKSYLQPTVFYRFFVARCHTLIAKYAVAIGRVKEACSHLNYIIKWLLPPARAEDSSYPDIYLSVWVEMLEAATYCSGVANSTVVMHSPGSSVPQMQQICPNRILLEWSARIFELDALRNLIYNCCSVEIRAKYDLALAKWIWGTQEIANSDGHHSDGSTNEPITLHTELEMLRPKMLSILHETLERVNNHVNCSETTAETMALFGPKLVELGKLESGEETLTNAIRISLHTKNVLLQSRLVVDIFRLYQMKQLSHAQATTAEKYEKKVNTLKRRITEAQAQESQNNELFKWMSDELSPALGSSQK